MKKYSYIAHNGVVGGGVGRSAPYPSDRVDLTIHAHSEKEAIAKAIGTIERKVYKLRSVTDVPCDQCKIKVHKVKSRSEAGVVHEVTEHDTFMECTCKAYEFRKTCRHIQIVLEKINLQEQ